MFAFKVFAHPLNKMVLENPLDELVEQVWCDEFVDIGVGEVFCEGLDSGEPDFRLHRLTRGLTLASLMMP
jgi:hypothetical protein